MAADNVRIDSLLLVKIVCLWNKKGTGRSNVRIKQNSRSESFGVSFSGRSRFDSLRFASLALRFRCVAFLLEIADSIVILK